MKRAAGCLAAKTAPLPIRYGLLHYVLSFCLRHLGFCHPGEDQAVWCGIDLNRVALAEFTGQVAVIEKME